MDNDKRVKAAALKSAKKLDEACSAMNGLMSAWLSAGYPDEHGIADSRRLLIERMSEYACHLDAVFNKP